MSARLRAVADAAAEGRRLSVVVSLCGSAGDPQGLDRQAQAFSGAGAVVHLSNAAAARAAVALAVVPPGAAGRSGEKLG